jgi:hypothetical protein
VTKRDDREPVGDWQLVCSWRDDRGRGVVHLSPLMHTREAVVDYQRYHRALLHDGRWLTMRLVHYTDGRARELDVWTPTASGEGRWHALDAGRWRSEERFVPPEVVRVGIRTVADALKADHPDECTYRECHATAERYDPAGQPWCETHLPRAEEPPPAIEQGAMVE